MGSVNKILVIFFLLPLFSLANEPILDSTEVAFFEEKGFALDSCSNSQLFDFVCQWIETPYQYGGKSMDGVDCSSLSKKLYDEVYQTTLTGTSLSLYNSCQPIKKEELIEGDLVFFKIYSNKISHVGIYLGQNKFIHASTKLGVTINDLDETYYSERFFSGGRIPELAESE